MGQSCYQPLERQSVMTIIGYWTLTVAIAHNIKQQKLLVLSCMGPNWQFANFHWQNKNQNIKGMNQWRQQYRLTQLTSNSGWVRIMTKLLDHRWVVYKQLIIMLNFWLTHLNLRISSLILFNWNLEGEDQARAVFTFRITDKHKLGLCSEKYQLQDLEKDNCHEFLGSLIKITAILIKLLRLTNWWLQVQRLCV